MICEKHHTFDFNKSGYLYLYQTNKANHGDNQEMVQARTDFLSTGAYAFLKEELVRHTHEEDIVADLACGEGYYTCCLSGKEKYGLDLSKEALRHAARQDKTTQYILSSIFELPFEDNSVDTVITCFAPVSSLEIPRVLKQGGTFTLVTPGPEHLFELKQAIYDNPYKNIVKDIDIPLQLIEEKTIEHRFTADTSALLSLFKMTPYAYKTGKQGMEKIQSLSSLNVTAQFVVRTYQK